MASDPIERGVLLAGRAWRASTSAYQAELAIVRAYDFGQQAGERAERLFEELRQQAEEVKKAAFALDAPVQTIPSGHGVRCAVCGDKAWAIYDCPDGFARDLCRDHARPGNWKA